MLGFHWVQAFLKRLFSAEWATTGLVSNLHKQRVFRKLRAASKAGQPGGEALGVLSFVNDVSSFVC